MYEINTKKPEEINEGSNEGNNGEEFGESDDVEGCGGANLVAPSVEEIVSDGEEESEENAVG